MIKSPLTAGNRSPPPPPAPFKKCIEWMFKWMFYVPMTSILTLPLLMVLSPTPALLHALIQQETGPPKTTYNRTVKGSCGALQSEPGREGLVGPYSQSQDERVLWGLTVRARTRGSCGALQSEPGREGLRIRKEPGREGLVGPYSQSQDKTALSLSYSLSYDCKFSLKTTQARNMEKVYVKARMILFLSMNNTQSRQNGWGGGGGEGGEGGGGFCSIEYGKGG